MTATTSPIPAALPSPPGRRRRNRSWPRRKISSRLGGVGPRGPPEPGPPRPLPQGLPPLPPRGPAPQGPPPSLFQIIEVPFPAVALALCWIALVSHLPRACLQDIVAGHVPW